MLRSNTSLRSARFSRSITPRSRGISPYRASGTPAYRVLGHIACEAHLLRLRCKSRRYISLRLIRDTLGNSGWGITGRRGRRPLQRGMLAQPKENYFFNRASGRGRRPRRPVIPQPEFPSVYRIKRREIYRRLLRLRREMCAARSDVLLRNNDVPVAVMLTASGQMMWRKRQ